MEKSPVSLGFSLFANESKRVISFTGNPFLVATKEGVVRANSSETKKRIIVVTAAVKMTRSPHPGLPGVGMPQIQDVIGYRSNPFRNVVVWYVSCVLNPIKDQRRLGGHMVVAVIWRISSSDLDDETNVRGSANHPRSEVTHPEILSGPSNKNQGVG
jgi:hypothetical protein